jgi:predicted phosphohydrolase
MKINLVSDLHIDFDPKDVTDKYKDEILILAGDLCESRKWRSLTSFLEYHSSLYKEVIYVPGNHEYYTSSIEKTNIELEAISSKIPNLHFLNNSKVIIDDVVYIGSTLWSDFENDNPISKMQVEKGLYDYSLIDYKGKPISTDDVLSIFKINVFYLEYELKKHKEDKVVVITHHAPSYQSIHPKYNSHGLNGGFASDLNWLIESNPQIRYWFHGHTHTSFNYLIGETRIVCNPKGYGKENSEYNPNLTLEI